MSSRSDFFTLERKKVTIYSDFTSSFEKNPTTGLLATNTNEDSVKRSLRNIVLTRLGERFYDTKKGTRIASSLFELYDPAVLEFAKHQLREAISAYEPRANPFEVNIINDIDRNGIFVRITFQTINIIGPPVTFDIFVVKIR